jgi:hypothetical protein
MAERPGEKNMNANVKYELSQAGQLSAIQAGRTATQYVTEALEVGDLIARCRVSATGTLEFDGAETYGMDRPRLDAPPTTLADVVVVVDAIRAQRQAAHDAAGAKAKAEQDAKLALVGEHKQVFDAALDILRALDCDAGAGISIYRNDPHAVRLLPVAVFGVLPDLLYVSREDVAVLDDIIAGRSKASAERKAQVAREAADKIAAEIAEHGGFVFPVAAGMCEFSGRNLWQGGQTVRWVGTFTEARGIDRFLDSPRGEFAFGVAGLKVGDRIQGGGYEKKYNGKRRHESEFFGVVVSVRDSEIVVREYPSRAAALAGAAALAVANA